MTKYLKEFETYKTTSVWSTYASVIEAIPSE